MPATTDWDWGTRKRVFFSFAFCVAEEGELCSTGITDYPCAIIRTAISTTMARTLMRAAPRPQPTGTPTLRATIRTSPCSRSRMVMRSTNNAIARNLLPSRLVGIAAPVQMASVAVRQTPLPIVVSTAVTHSLQAAGRVVQSASRLIMQHSWQPIPCSMDWATLAIAKRAMLSLQDPRRCANSVRKIRCLHRGRRFLRSLRWSRMLRLRLRCRLLLQSKNPSRPRPIHQTIARA
ncbi:hypothetical protein BC939DRAFT_39947 [Gamsiella multidivaricata]|uniref:uncharacterized protein n=1 Tax=Gamsiella multidivaricata TaxID=101098 RepID=UPI0022211375|nr:uncharacterized protein BC939DRAFT_39947 [Gamsiella multidivaricata]KAI7828999.1 hypothetical protein BC939DRAFT_39947 [Gamsiella multidivaricata]